MKNPSSKSSAAGILAAAIFAVVIAGCASTPAESTPATAAAAPAAAKDNDCFNGRQINGWNRVSDDTVRVSVGPSKSYDLKLMSKPVNSLNFQETIAVKAGPSDWICTGNGLGVEIVTGGIGPQSYPVTSVVRAPTPAQEREAKAKAEADAAAAKPN